MVWRYMDVLVGAALALVDASPFLSLFHEGPSLYLWWASFSYN